MKKAYYLLWAVLLAFVASYSEIWQTAVVLLVTVGLVVLKSLSMLDATAGHMKAVHKAARDLLDVSQAKIDALQEEVKTLKR